MYLGYNYNKGFVNQVWGTF